MEETKDIKIVIARGEYWEMYSPFQEEPEVGRDKVIRGILKEKGLRDAQIDKLIDTIEIVPDQGGLDGQFDDGPYTPIALIRHIKEEPEPPEIVEIPEIPEPPKDLATAPRQIMLHQFYGNRREERLRREKFARYKSHITQKEIEVYDEDKGKRKVTVYTVEDYPEKAQDADDLLISGYQTRLERLSRAHQKDFSPYEREYSRTLKMALQEIIDKYEEMHKVKPQEAEKFKEDAMRDLEELRGSDEFKKKAIQALIDRDIEFIETNNYGYNSHQNTQENIKTLGKFGEKSVRSPVYKKQPIYQKMGLHTMNALIAIRNFTVAPVNQAIGTFVAAPIHRAIFRVGRSKSKEPVNVDGFLITPMEDMIATSQKHSTGMFKNKPSHRYTARKDYFIEQEKMSMGDTKTEETDTKTGKKKVPKTSLGKLFRLAVVPRVNAIFNWREGNIAVLNAGLHDIEEATDKRKTDIALKHTRLTSTYRRIAAYEKEIDDLTTLLHIATDDVEKEQLRRAIEMRKTGLLKLQGRAIEIERTEVDSVQTDAVSMSEHDKANKANMTRVVRGVKTAGRIATGMLISRYLYREIAHKTKLEDTYEYIPGKTEQVKEEVVREIIEEKPGLSKLDIGKITLGDIYKKGSGKLSYYYGQGGNQVIDKSKYFRGLAFKYDGKLISGSDGKGFDIAGRTDILLDQELTGDTSIVSVIQEILQDKTGQTFSADMVSELIAEGKISGIDIWRSTMPTGIPTGWLGAEDIVPQLISEGTHKVARKIKEEVVKTITTPGTMKLIPGREIISHTRELNPAIAAAEAGLVGMEIADFNDLARFTRSKESIFRRAPRTLETMEAINNKVKEEEKKAKEKAKGDKTKKDKKRDDKSIPLVRPPAVKKLRDIKSFQRNNKSKRRFYGSISERMRIASRMAKKTKEGAKEWEGFIGTKRGDLRSGYDENLIGVNDPEIPIKEDEGRDD